MAEGVKRNNVQASHHLITAFYADIIDIILLNNRDDLRRKSADRE